MLTNLALHRYVCLITLYLQGVQWIILGKAIKSKALRDEAGRFSIQFHLYSASQLLVSRFRISIIYIHQAIGLQPVNDSSLHALHSLSTLQAHSLYFTFLSQLFNSTCSSTILQIFATCLLFFFPLPYIKHLKRNFILKT